MAEWIQSMIQNYSVDLNSISALMASNLHEWQSPGCLLGSCPYVPESTVDSRYLEFGYLEFCETQSVYLNQIYILIAFSNHNLELETFL